MTRPAVLQDLDELVRLENLCFKIDRFSRRSFRYLLTKANAVTLVEPGDDGLRAYVIVLFHTGTSLARLYSLAVHPEARGSGLGRLMIEAAERIALERDGVTMRLEVRKDNSAAIALYQKLGYRQFGHYDDYYEDHGEALRFEKRLVSGLALDLAQVPYYRQTLDFTCGPAALMMAMMALDNGLALSRRDEIRIWRESTTVFMTSGHGGTGPFGLALAAWHRGFWCELFVSDDGALFVDSVRNEEKKAVIRLVQEDFLDELARHDLPVHYRHCTLEEMQEGFERGGIPLVLISSYRIYQEKFPHWVVVSGFDDKFIYVHDPYVDEEKGKSPMDVINMPILRRDFERMARYGKSGLRAALMLYRKEK